MSKKQNLAEVLREAMSSEHTSYKSTKRFLKTLPTKGKQVIQGPGENAGIIDLGRGWALALRIESHNHPSFIKPYHGAATGIGGILRDIFTMGARPIALLDPLRFGTDSYSKKIIWGVVRGIADYGNCVGVPTVGGEIFFDKTYDHNCLVNVCCLGLVKKSKIIYGHALTPGNDLIYVGARTGRDGIGGATMASKSLNKLDASTVQEADPFLEKLLLDACGELAQTKWVEGMQDMGAAGLLCSTTEVAIRGSNRTGKKIGTKVYLDRIPQKTKNMRPDDLLLSESQERMLIVGKRQYRKQILHLFKKWDLEAAVVGEVTNDGKYSLYWQGKQILHENLDYIVPEVEEEWPLTKWKTQGTKYMDADDQSKKKIWTQYDWNVGTRTIKGPNQPGKYAIMDIPEADKELVVAWSSDVGRSDRDPYHGVQWAFDKCYKRIKRLGGTPLGLTNCLNFGHPNDSMGAFSQTVEGLKDRCLSYGVAVVSGNVSLYNSHKEHSIKPTPVLVMVGTRARKTQFLGIKSA